MKKLSLFLTLSLFALLSSAQTAFIENKGQVVDQNGLPNPQALFVLPLSGMNVVLRADGFSYDVYEVQTVKPTTATLADQLRMGLEITSPQPERIAVHRVDISFEAMNKGVQIEKHPLSGSATYNYYTTGTPNVGIHDVRQFSKVVYRNIYDGIDIEFVASAEKGMEYNFIIQAGADMEQIAMSYNGALALQLKENTLHIDLATNDLVESIPASYLQGSHQPLDVRYALEQNTLRFATTENITGEAIIIDPTPNLVYATYFGGPSEEMIEDSEMDNEGNMYMAGHTTSTSSIATAGAFQTEIGGTYDVLITKFDPDYQLEWATYMGGSGWDYSSAVNLADDAIFITGLTLSTTGMASDGAFQEALAGFQNGFTSRFDLSGSRVWSSYFGTSVETFGGAGIVDGNTLVAVGSTQSSTLPFSLNPFQVELNGFKDCLISQWDLDGNPIYCSYFGGEGLEVFNDVVQAENGLIWIVGGTGSNDGIATNDAYQEEFGGGIGDLMLVAFTTNFELYYSTYFGADGDENAYDIEYSNGKIIIAGTSNYGDLLTTADAYQAVGFGQSDMLFAIFNSDLEVEYCTLFGGENYEGSSKMLMYGDELYFVGSTQSLENISTDGSYQEDFMDSDIEYMLKIFIGKMDANNDLVWCTYFGNYSFSGAADLHIYDGKLIVTGWSRSTSDLPLEMQLPISTPDAYQTENAGAEDAFIAVFDSFTGVEIVEDANGISIFPNPAGNVLNLSAGVFIEHVEVTNALGQQVLVATYNQKNVQLDIAHLAQGAYLCNVQLSDGTMSTMKWMKW